MYKTLIILDWDDTLFPTSWAIKNNIDVTDKNKINEMIYMFSKLDNTVHLLLTRLQKYGKVVIVTNAATKWVKISSNVLPKTQRLISTTIQIISAREVVQDKFPDNMKLWKKIVFEELVMNYFSDYGYQHIISVGDAEYEFFALIDLYNERSLSKERLLKTVRFMTTPSLESLIDQQEVFISSMNKILNNKNHMDLRFSSQ